MKKYVVQQNSGTKVYSITMAATKGEDRDPLSSQSINQNKIYIAPYAHADSEALGG